MNNNISLNIPSLTKSVINDHKTLPSAKIKKEKLGNRERT